ncbi:MAG: ABC transporter permease [Candidatus Acetothermia bacterium]
MISYAIRRIFSMIPSLIVAGILVFSFMHLMPGDPAAVMLGPNATAEQVKNLRESMGFNRPIYVQFGEWAQDVVQGDLGRSIFFHKPVSEVILSRAETSVFIALISMTLVLTFGISVGIISAVRHNSWIDQLSLGFAMLGASIPTFWLGLNLMLLFAVILGWLPSSGFPSVLESGDITNLRYLILPCITLAAPNSALVIRLTRSSMLDVLGEDYINTARSKGLHENKVIVKHALRNAFISIIAVLGFTFVGLLSGTVVTETVFSLPGVGRLVVQSILRRDYPVIQGVLLIVVIGYMIVNLMIDISYAFLDPRIRYD